MGFYDDYKLQATDYTGKDIESLPDVVSGQATTLKARFDALVKEVVAARFNAFLQGLDAEFISGDGTHHIYVSATAPSNPQEGDIWIDIS